MYNRFENDPEQPPQYPYPGPSVNLKEPVKIYSHPFPINENPPYPPYQMKEPSVLNTNLNFKKDDFNHMDQYALGHNPINENPPYPPSQMKEPSVLNTNLNFQKGDFNHMDQHALGHNTEHSELNHDDDHHNINHEKQHNDNAHPHAKNAVSHSEVSLCCCCCCFGRKCDRDCEACCDCLIKDCNQCCRNDRCWGDLCFCLCRIMLECLLRGPR